MLIAKVKNYNLNVTEVRYPAFPMFFPGIFNFTVGILLTLFFKNIFRPPPTQQSTNEDQSDAVRSRLNNCRILQRNFESCVDAAQTSKEPCERARYNEAATPTPNNPTARDFGYLERDDFLKIQG